MRHDAAQPARQVRVRLDGRQMAVQLHEHVLGQVLGGGAIVEHPAGDPEHQPLVMAHQVGEGVQVAAPGPGQPAIPGVGAGIGPGDGRLGRSRGRPRRPRRPVRSRPGLGPASKSPSACLLRKAPRGRVHGHSAARASRRSRRPVPGFDGLRAARRMAGGRDGPWRWRRRGRRAGPGRGRRRAPRRGRRRS